MKKTFLMIAALAGVAAADTLTLYAPHINAYTNNGIASGTGPKTVYFGTAEENTPQAITLNAWSIDFTLAYDTTRPTSTGSIVSNGPSGAGAGQNVIGTSVVSQSYSEGSGTYVVSFFSNNANPLAPEQTITVNYTGENGGGTTSYTGDILRLSYLEGTAYLKNVTTGDTISWTPDSAVLSTLTSGQSKMWTGNNKNTQFLSVADLSTVSFAEARAYAAPEPTAATLSLLALAGLAARRRRR